MSSVLDLFDVNEHWYNDIDYLNPFEISKCNGIISIPLDHRYAVGLSQCCWEISMPFGCYDTVRVVQCCETILIDEIISMPLDHLDIIRLSFSNWNNSCAMYIKSLSYFVFPLYTERNSLRITATVKKLNIYVLSWCFYWSISISFGVKLNRDAPFPFCTKLCSC